VDQAEKADGFFAHVQRLNLEIVAGFSVDIAPHASTDGSAVR
jgi:hypothetical protein